MFSSLVLFLNFGQFNQAFQFVFTRQKKCVILLDFHFRHNYYASTSLILVFRLTILTVS